MAARTSPRVVVFPYYADNPFTDLLYSGVRATGYEVRGVRALDAFVAAAAELRAGDVLHVQWTSPIAHVGRDVEDSWRRVEVFQRAVRSAARRGVPLVWTLHNRLPHDLRYLEPELALVRFLIARSAAVHVLNRASAAAVADLYELPPAKTVVIPHSSYRGVYPQELTRQAARDRFGLADDDTAVLFFGQMRPYKGLDRLFDAVSRVNAAGPRVTLLLAGRVHPDDADRLEASLPAWTRILRSDGQVGDDDVQLWFSAADVTVLPYRHVLNSGTTLLSATFGVPVVLPDNAHLRAEFGAEPWVHFFEPDHPGGLERELAGFAASAAERDAALHFAELNPPARMAESFLALVERVRSERLDADRPGARATRHGGRPATAASTPRGHAPRA